MSPGRSKGSTRSRMVSTSSPLEPLSGRPQSWLKMHIDRQVRTAPTLGSHPNDAEAPAREATDLGMRLDAANEIAVGDRSLHGRVDVDAIGPIEVRIIMSFQPADEIGREEGVSARLRLLGNEVPEAG